MITTIEELQQHKSKLRESLDKAFQEFEAQTGFGFEYVGLCYLDSVGSYVRSVRVGDIRVSL